MLAFRNEDCKGGKNSRKCETIFIGTNVTGERKFSRLIIKKFANPSCFKNMKLKPMT